MKKLLLALSLALLSVPAFAQQTGVRGSVFDESQAVIIGAVVNIKSESGSVNTSTISNETGVFQFPAIPAGKYVLTVETPGFTTAAKSFQVLVGQYLTVDFTLTPAQTTTLVEVSAAAVEISTTSSQIAGNVDPMQMTETPLNGRNWMELALLVPGVTANSVGSTPLASDNGRFQINIDGQQVTQNSAGSGFGQAQYSREAISEFQIITNRFDATLGRSLQIQINAQSKGGTNEFHGAAYGYFRDDSMNAADKVAQRVLPFGNQQYGGTFGGPILKDKLFFFGSYEAERQPSTIFLTPTGFPGQTFDFDSKLDTKTYLGRVDYQINDANRASLRVSGGEFAEPFAGLSGSSHPSRAYDNTRTSYSAFGNWSWAGPTLVNEVKAGFNHFDWARVPYVESQEYRLGGGITIGGPYNYPQQFNMDATQIRDDVFWLKGDHSFKFGAEYLRNVHTGIFQQNIRGVGVSFSQTPADLPAIFPQWDDPSSWDLDALSPLATSFVQGFGNFDIDIPRNIVAFWFQDDWKINQKLTVNLGMRYDNDIGIWEAGVTVASGILEPRGNDNNNFAPRLGFAYDLFGNRKTVVRGGLGLYYAEIVANMIIDQQIFDGETSIQATAEARGSDGINLRDPFDGATGDDFISGAVPTPPQSIQPVDGAARTPYSVQGSIGFETQLSNDFVVSADWVHYRVYNDWMRFDSNLFYNPDTGFQAPPSTFGRPNEAFANIQEFQTPNAAGALYDGLQVQVRKNFGEKLALNVAYTWSYLKDSTTSGFYYPNNFFDPADEWAVSSANQDHTLNFSGNYELPLGFRIGAFYHYGSGQNFQIGAGSSPFGTLGTNRTFRDTAKFYGDPSTVHPARLAPGLLIVDRNSLVGLPIHRIDTRLTKVVNIGERFRVIGIVEAFNLFNRANYGSYQTNTLTASYGSPVQNTNLSFAARMLQLAVRFEF